VSVCMSWVCVGVYVVDENRVCVGVYVVRLWDRDVWSEPMHYSVSVEVDTNVNETG